MLVTAKLGHGLDPPTHPNLPPRGVSKGYSCERTSVDLLILNLQGCWFEAAPAAPTDTLERLCLGGGVRTMVCFSSVPLRLRSSASHLLLPHPPLWPL